MPTLLGAIKEPSDLRKLRPKELNILAQEIRQTLISTVTSNGGHLASNLGVVELTIALHRFFSSPEDKILWDVGHQSYVHKLLTGRQSYFSKLRQADGLSGFSEPKESIHDAFISGHASTSVSAAVGIAIARDLAGKKYEVIAVIGDGSMGGGMAFEALNHIGHLKKKIVVVLNDNGMAISPSVGAQARWLNKIRLNHRYHAAKGETEQILLRTPEGRFILQGMKQLKTGVKRIFLPPTMWEQMGFRYIGPIDGHNLKELDEAFDKSQHYINEPVLIHVFTVKGKGYAPAEKDAVGFHGLPPNGEGAKRAPNYNDIFGNTLMQLFNTNKKLVAISAAMLEGTGLNKLAKTYPDRVFDVGICEQHAVTMAAGLASRGFIPIVAIYSTFLQRAYD
ncbi:MAG TPA: 1-deoxy-D-xylulose-5-phosphate synthase, partial [Candidatus Brocadiales bacterium]|nr:1-deoxy-D-xylulose-5-phosphate synthase [Candidatus Brocadiales bacterium]